jgi:hypothetical protein
MLRRRFFVYIRYPERHALLRQDCTLDNPAALDSGSDPTTEEAASTVTLADVEDTRAAIAAAKAAYAEYRNSTLLERGASLGWDLPLSPTVLHKFLLYIQYDFRYSMYMMSATK